MLGNKTNVFVLSHNVLKKRCFFWNSRHRRLHLSTTFLENEQASSSQKEKLRMKQNRKEAKRKEYIEILRRKQLENKEKQPLFQSELNGLFPETYNSAHVESKWYNYWVDQGVFNVDSSCHKNRKEIKDRFVMCLPPPNVTGNLHLGHALGCSIQDAISRWHRMRGERVTWVPGCDHAGIATQVVVEKKLKKELGVSRHDLGREKFLKEVWKWKERYGGEILEQMKRLGCSLDWSRMTFTLDPKLSMAVKEAFIRLYEEGIIHRSKRMISWSCALKSAISDAEVENLSLSGPTKLKVPGYEREIQFGIMNTFSYPIYGSDKRLNVSTTRLETMLGDVGVAVHPDDPRYSQLIGSHVIHPFTDKPLPIVADTAVDPHFGTGAVKLTPGHDSTDLQIAMRHHLDLVNILDESGCLINVPHEFMNLPRFEARDAIKEKLNLLGLFVAEVGHPMNLPICSRSQDVIEYFIKDQWFVDCKEMTKSALEAVESGKLEFVPNHYNRQWKEWMSNTSEWCISRQLWWGHRIPAYRISTSDGNTKERWVAAHDENEAKMKASKLLGKSPDDIKLYQDEDVLDTWFSSSLIPFSVFGWPNKTSDMARFYPTDLLETASDIMLFWVGRMVMMGEKLTGQLPFKKVHFHSIIQDAKGRKMSKSLGNVIDPMHVIKGITLEELHAGLDASNLSSEEIGRAKPILARDFPLGIPECGADALRFALCSYNYHSHVINVDVNYMKFCKTFCNKIWQSFRFVSGRIRKNEGRFEPIDIEKATLHFSPIDKWILSRLSSVICSTNEAFDSLRLFDATKSLQNFWWSEFCSVYLECIKPLSGNISAEENNVINSILVFTFQNFLKLLHPFMPFLTEHLFHELKKISKIGDDLNPVDTISLAEYPTYERFQQFSDEKVENELKLLLDISSKINSFKSLLKLNRSVQIPAFLTVNDGSKDIAKHTNAMKTLSKLSSVNFLTSTEHIPTGCIFLGDVDGYGVYLQLKGAVNTKEHIDDLLKLKNKHEKEKDNFERHPAFNDSNHNEHLVVKEKVTGLNTILHRIKKTLISLEEI